MAPSQIAKRWISSKIHLIHLSWSPSNKPLNDAAEAHTQKLSAVNYFGQAANDKHSLLTNRMNQTMLMPILGLIPKTIPIIITAIAQMTKDPSQYPCNELQPPPGNIGSILRQPSFAYIQNMGHGPHFVLWFCLKHEEFRRLAQYQLLLLLRHHHHQRRAHVQFHPTKYVWQKKYLITPWIGVAHQKLRDMEQQ